jgi:hypothetical protein
MAFTVEDGTGVEGANTYITLEEAEAYFFDRNIPWPTRDIEVQRQGEIVIATTYVDSKYSWPGTRKSRSQGLQWPREDATDREGHEIAENSVPIEVKNAVCEAVLVYSELNLALDRGGMIASVTVGPISETYMNGASPGKVFPKIDAAVRPIVVGGKGRVVVTR